MASGDITTFQQQTACSASTLTDGSIRVPAGYTVLAAGWTCRETGTGDEKVVEIFHTRPDPNDPRGWLCQFISPVAGNFYLYVTARED